MTASQTIDTPGGRFAYLAAGDPGAPLVLCLHGFPDHPRSFVPLMAELAEAGYRAVAPWTRGYAPSTLDGPFHLERLADDACALADALAPGRPAALIGHDWGAVTAYTAAARAPTRFSCAITMAVPHPMAVAANLTQHPEQLRRSWYILFFQIPMLADWAVARDDFDFIDRLWRAWSPGYRLPAGDRAELKACLRQSMPAPLGYYRALVRPLADAARRAGPDSPTRQRVALPILHLHGADDGCVGPELAEGAERFSTGPYHREVVDGAGHFLQLERPVWVAQRVLWWLAQHGPTRR